MVELEEVHSANAALVQSQPLVAVFFGGTSGIAHQSLRALTAAEAQHGGKGLRLYIVARNASVAADITTECRGLYPQGQFTFVKIDDLSLIRNVDRACAEIIQHEEKEGQNPRIDYLMMSQGGSIFGPRIDTKEGLDITMALMYYSRMRAIVKLLPLLLNSTLPAHVVSVYAAGYEAKLYPEDLSLRDLKRYSYSQARSHMIYMHVLFMEYLAEKYPGKLSLAHIFPGLVIGPGYYDPGHPMWFKIMFRVMNTLFGRFLTVPPSESGDRMVSLASPRYPPRSSSPSKTYKEGTVAVGTDGKPGSGVYSLGWRGDNNIKAQAYENFNKDEMRKRIWDHTTKAFEVIEAESIKLALRMPDSHRNANQTPAQQRLRRGPAFLLNTPSARSGSGSQFASPPRFLLSQHASRVDNNSQFHRSAALSPFRASPVGTYRRSLAYVPDRIHDLTIEDDISPQYYSNESDEEREGKTDACQGGDISTELDRLFDSPRDSHKRRRISSSQSKGKTDQPIRESMDEIQDFVPSYSDDADLNEVSNHTLASPFTHRTSGHPSRTFETPAPTRHRRYPDPRTPNDVAAYKLDMRSSSKTPAFHSPPRYIVSANYTPSLAPHASPATVPSASALSHGRKKPIFVLPRSPSPVTENHASRTPAPISPTLSQRPHRRGRPTSSDTTARYVPGGLAEQLRDWILEKGAERDRTIQQLSRRDDDAQYVLTARIDSCRHTYLKSSGHVMIVRATPRRNGNGEELKDKETVTTDDLQQKELLLLSTGASDSCASNRHADTHHQSLGTKLKPGDIIGIRAGLTWEIELDALDESHDEHNEPKISEQRVIASSQSPSVSDEEDGDEMETRRSISPQGKARTTWLVAAEWVRLRESVLTPK
ncbi:hypothetical protein UA08_02353 [Talaromyces atroroseus]|uniref:Uncharacterized protein n=1 Tax=Talaromyces atroroseus TaxID=1441469 RepID=A0A225AJR7_TALAT|nr:hypothetical protein UA08_02353 [Talaromyces atroroseus]OKL61761.1 hypothetical protein UA08_02353 [Talaromyces atroroseus]